MKTSAILATVGAAFLGMAAVDAQETRERLSRVIPDTRSQSFDDRRLVTPHMPGATEDREPKLDLSGDLGSPFEGLGRNENGDAKLSPGQRSYRIQGRAWIDRQPGRSGR